MFVEAFYEDLQERKGDPIYIKNIKKYYEDFGWKIVKQAEVFYELKTAPTTVCTYMYGIKHPSEFILEAID